MSQPEMMSRASCRRIQCETHGIRDRCDGKFASLMPQEANRDRTESIHPRGDLGLPPVKSWKVQTSRMGPSGGNDYTSQIRTPSASEAILSFVGMNSWPT